MENNFVSIYLPTRAKTTKRLGAFLLDFILVLIIGTGIMYLASLIYNYDSYEALFNQGKEIYGIRTFDAQGNAIDCNPYEEACRLMYDSLYADATYNEAAYRMKVFMIFGPIIGLFVGDLFVEFIIPMIFENGQTVGMKAMQISLISNNGIRITSRQLFVKFLFGKFIIATFIPAFALYYIIYSNGVLMGITLLVIFVIAEIVCVWKSTYKVVLSDFIAAVYPVETKDLFYFDSVEELNAAKAKEKEMHKNDKKNEFR